MKKPTSLLQNWRSLGNINSRWQPLVPQESVSLGKASQQSRSAFISVSSQGMILHLQGSWNHGTSEVNDAWVSIIHQPQGCWVRRGCAGKEVHVCLIANLPQELTTGFYFYFCHCCDNWTFIKLAFHTSYNHVSKDMHTQFGKYHFCLRL